MLKRAYLTKYRAVCKLWRNYIDLNTPLWKKKSTDRRRNTALHIVSKSGNLEVARILVNKMKPANKSKKSGIVVRHGIHNSLQVRGHTLSVTAVLGPCLNPPLPQTAF